MAMTALRLRSLNAWNGDMLAVHDQAVRFYCCALDLKLLFVFDTI